MLVTLSRVTHAPIEVSHLHKHYNYVVYKQP
jgi:hypothetical protein